MDILILQGPRPAARRLAFAATARLWRIAHVAGHVLNVHACASPALFIDAIHRVARSRNGFVLLDPGACHVPDCEPLREALDAMAVPHVQVHDRSEQALDLPLRPCAQPVATIVIHDDLAAGYSIALAVALRRLR